MLGLPWWRAVGPVPNVPSMGGHLVRRAALAAAARSSSLGLAQLRPERSWLLTQACSSSSGVYKYLHHQFRIDDMTTATELVDHFLPQERALLLSLLSKKVAEDKLHAGEVVHSKVSPSMAQMKQLFVVNMVPFIGFGILDNMLMIMAGEYIDRSLGLLLGISTMAAAALGNILSDVAGVGLAYQVEKMVSYLGVKHPVLTGEQLESKSARFVVNFARALGLVVGCLIGMFPLLFFEKEKKGTEKSSEDTNKR